MTQDTEDVVARVNRRIDLLEQGDPRAATWVADFREILADRQSLSDRIDELRDLALKVVNLHDEVVGCTRPGGVDADEYDDAFEDLRHAALHQEGIAP